jgi:hypothetical protein
MLIHAAQPLFAWGQLEDCPTLQTIRLFLETLPARELLDGLHQARGHGRDDCPIPVRGRIVVLTSLRRHTGFEACLAERHRNPSLCQLLDISAEDDLPQDWNISRFLGAVPFVRALGIAEPRA